MVIANIFVPLTGSSLDPVALATAFAAAAPFRAHVSAVFVTSELHEAAFGWPSMPDASRTSSDAHLSLTAKLRENARAAFAAGVIAGRARIATLAERSDCATASYREETGRLTRILDVGTPFADIVVFPPLTGQHDAVLHDAFIHTLLKCERPVLLSPEMAPEKLGEKPALGWDNGLAAAHALAAALPILEFAGTVQLLCVGQEPGFDLADVTEYMTLHGVKTAAHALPRTSRPIGEILLDATAESGCDLLIAGGYGHSRTLESVFGGVTEHVVSHVRIPILLVH